ncbi:MAG TPA: hypothetical protein DCO79_12170 [Spirochaeta sp.]|nr:hypothetical protein [Spirochaeta sp.]
MLKKMFLLLIFAAVSIFIITADDGFGDIFEADESADLIDSSPGGVSFSGNTGFILKSYMDDGWGSELTSVPYLNLEIAPSSGDFEAMIRINLDEEIISTEILDELYLRYFFNYGYLEAGLMKAEWGKGDGYHVLDPLNPLNQSDGVVPDLNEMKDAVAMLKLNLYAGTNGLLEFVYVPIFSGHSIAETGRWAVIDPSSIPNLITDLPGGLSGSSAALRYTTSLGPLDLGFQYYYGYKPEPGYRFESEFIGTNPAQMADPAFWETNTTMLYTRAHLAGIEAGWAAGPFTFRTEIGSWLTEDIEGDLPEYWNSSLVALAGIDLLLPGTNLFFSLQATESWVLDYEDRGLTDVNTAAAYDNNATTTTIIPALEMPFGRDKFNLRMAGLYLVEAAGWMAYPSLSWYPVDGYEIGLSGQFFGGEKDSYYKSWEGNGTVSLEFKYIF